MAKKAQKKAKKVVQPAHVAAAVAAAAASDEVPIIVVPPGGTLTIVVDVGQMTIPYTVAYNKHTLIKSLVDRAEPVPLAPNDHMLGWSFGHTVKGWSHSIAYSISGAPLVVLEARSEAKKDPDHSVGMALVRS